MPTLREVQAAFARCMLDPSLVGAIEGRIASDAIAAERRLAIHRNNVVLSLQGMLERTFPATRKLLGPERFAEIAGTFVASEPPDRPQLITYGTRLPEFLEHSIEDVTARCLADVARLEWAREEAYYAADAAPLTAADLAEIPVARYPELRFQIHPSLRLIRSAGPVYTLWRAASGGADDPAMPPPGAGPEQVLVVRPEMTVTTRPIAAADRLLLAALGEGLPLAEAAARAEAADPEFDLQRALALHLAGGSFAGCR